MYTKLNDIRKRRFSQIRTDLTKIKNNLRNLRKSAF